MERKTQQGVPTRARHSKGKHYSAYIEEQTRSGRKNTRRATRGLLATDHVILNHGQVTWTTPELAPLLLTTTPHQREDVSALDRFSVHRCPTRRVFSATGLEQGQPQSDTLTTRLPCPQHGHHKEDCCFSQCTKCHLTSFQIKALQRASESAKNDLPMESPTHTFQRFLEKSDYVIDRDVIDFSNNFQSHP
ncbi:uncharacterized protein TNCV_4822181 [Trichonephila clavipes]|nr:uncharacterized protein TNCV_4822181 [Trichonephila clavipes]